MSVTLNYLFFMGWLSFLWGVPFALIGVALVYRLMQRPTLSLVLLSNLSLVMAYWSHLVSFGLGLVCVLILTILAGPRRLLAGLAGWVPASVVVVMCWSHSANVLSDWQYRDTVVERLWRVVSYRVATSFGGLEIPLAAVFGLLVLAVAIIAGARRMRRDRFSPLVVLCVSVLVLALSVPRGAGSGFYIDDRVALFFWLLVFAVASYVGKRVAAVVSLAAVIFCVVQLVFLERQFQQFNEDYSVLASAVDRIPAGAEVFVYSFIGDMEDCVVKPFANPNSRVALATKGSNYYHYQADPRHSGHFLVRYTEDGLSRYVGERSFARIDPSEFTGFISHVVVWGDESPVETVLEARYGYRRQFEDSRVRLYGRPGKPLEAELAELSQVSDLERREALAKRIVQGRGLDQQILSPDRIVAANLYSDQWTRGTRKAALVVTNSGSETMLPLLRVRGPAEKMNPPIAFFVEDGESTRSFEFSRPRAQKIRLSSVPPNSSRLFIVWTNRGWYPQEENFAPRRVGLRLKWSPQSPTSKGR